MQLRAILAISILGLTVVGVVGWKLFIADIPGMARNEAEIDLGYKQAQAPLLALHLSAHDGLAEAAGDVQVDTVRLRRTSQIDAATLAQRVCADPNAKGLLIRHVRVYPFETANLASTNQTPELDQMCP